MNQKLRTLIQQLGEAIHETVSESEHIAGVVRDIRQEGFDVLLMLEATIGLNELEDEGKSDKKAAGAIIDEKLTGPFTLKDLHFLRSLRIGVEGEGEPGEVS